MGTSPSKRPQQTGELSPQQGSNGSESANMQHDGEECSNDSLDVESFVFIDKGRSCSISSAEDVLLIDNKYNDIFAKPEERNCTENLPEVMEQTGTSSADTIVRSSPREHSNPKQDSGKFDGGTEQRKESDPIDIILNQCSVSEEFPISPKSNNTQILLKSTDDNFTPPDVALSGKEAWVQIGGCDLKFYDIYEIFSTYGSLSALAKTKDHIYVKFSSWAGIANVFDNFRNLQQLHKINAIVKVEDDDLKNYPDRTEIYLDLPCVVVTYLKEHHELSKALNIVALTANDNICLNAPKIQQVLDHVRKSVSKGFQQCRLFPFGSLILGSCDRFAPLEIFVDVGDMYAGCHEQSNEEQIAIAKEVRKLISDDVVWYSDEESPIGIFYHKIVGLNCILNFNNGFGDRCTRLLGVFMDYDERFRILYLILEVWSKQCSLQGISNGLNSYIVAVLLVFYLQVLPVPLLPPIRRIRTGRRVVIKGWDCTFIEDASFLPRNECSTDLHSLLRGFFVFYGSYDWKRVVSPALGQSIDRNIFSSPCVPFPEDPIFANYFRTISENVPNTPHFEVSTSMCVQDFFNLSENVAKGVSPNILFRFQSLCRQSHKMIYSAESKMSFGSHKLHYLPLNFSPAPYMANHIGNGIEKVSTILTIPQMQMRNQLTNNCSHRAKFGSVSDSTTSSRSWERSSISDHPNENEHEMYCICERCTRINDRANSRENRQQCLQRQRNQQTANHNYFDEDARYQSNGSYKSRGRRVQESNSDSRPFRGRVFWHNGVKSKAK